MSTQYRFGHRFIPQNATEIPHPDKLGVVYSYTRGKHICAIAYAGKSFKASWHFSFDNEAGLQKRVNEFFSSLSGHAQSVCDRRADRSKPHSFQVGDIVVNSWGWEQTNVDFYKVVATTKNFVDLIKIGGKTVPGSTYSHGMAEMVVADPSCVIGSEIIRRKASAEGYVCFEHGCGRKDNGGKHYSSWYA